ncbi:MAG: pilus assembly protein PilP [Nitrospinota bacterium]|nr:pilus assembly protein PilP [Nitrospinota bacterium]
MNQPRQSILQLYCAIGIWLAITPAVLATEKVISPAMGQQASVTGLSGNKETVFPESTNFSLSKITALTTHLEGEKVSIHVQATDNIQYTAFKLYNPPRLILDLPQMQEGKISHPIAFNQSFIGDIRSMYFGDAQVLRLEISLKQGIPSYNISKPEKNQLLVTLSPVSQESGSQTPAPEKENQPAKDRELDSAANETPTQEDQQEEDPLADPCYKIFSGDKGKLSLDFQQADLRRILGIISETGGFNLVLSSKVSGKLAMRFAQVPWNLAFNKILKNNGLAKECFENIVRVLPKVAMESEEKSRAQIPHSKVSMSIDPCEEILLGKKSRISFDFKQANLRNTLRFISEIGGFNLMLSPSVSGSLTMELKDVPWDLALFMILRNTGLDQECSDNIIRVATRNVLVQEELARLAQEEARAKELAEEEKKVELPPAPKRFGKELRVLKSIPFELYRKIQDNDPRLHANLEHYSKLFKEKIQLKAMEIKSYFSLVKFYKQLIDQANGQGPEFQGTPLQVDLNSMKFVGILWNQAEPAALIETEDTRGHTLRPGTLVGPNFGVVESIEPEKIIIMERSRDYQGNIKSNTQEMELYQENQEPQERS